MKLRCSFWAVCLQYVVACQINQTKFIYIWCEIKHCDGVFKNRYRSWRANAWFFKNWLVRDESEHSYPDMSHERSHFWNPKWYCPFFSLSMWFERLYMTYRHNWDKSQKTFCTILLCVYICVIRASVDNLSQLSVMNDWSLC